MEKSISQISLKEQFIKIVNIILAEHPQFYLVKDFQTFSCSAPDATLICDTSIDIDDDCRKCQYHTFKNVDVQLFRKPRMKNEDDWEEQSFSFTEGDRDAILNEDDLYAVISKFNAYFTSSFKNQLNEYHRVEMFEKYAYKFFGKVIKDFSLLLNKNILPIKLHHDTKRNDYNVTKYGEIAFVKNSSNPQHIINIYNINNGNVEDNELYRTIRHEILRYCLYVSGLKFDETNGIFHALCIIYDGDSHKRMNTQQQSIFSHFLYIYYNIDDLIQSLKISEGRKLILQYMLRYLGRIPCDVDPDFVKAVEPIYYQLISEMDPMFA
jgi:hypothetical protein